MAALPFTSCTRSMRHYNGIERIAIMGAGLAALHPAYRLRQAGMLAQVYEASTRVVDAYAGLAVCMRWDKWPNSGVNLLTRITSDAEAYYSGSSISKPPRLFTSLASLTNASTYVGGAIRSVCHRGLDGAGCAECYGPVYRAHYACSWGASPLPTWPSVRLAALQCRASPLYSTACRTGRLKQQVALTR
jgi:hypothetical protein